MWSQKILVRMLMRMINWLPALWGLLSTNSLMPLDIFMGRNLGSIRKNIEGWDRCQNNAMQQVCDRYGYVFILTSVPVCSVWLPQQHVSTVMRRSTFSSYVIFCMLTLTLLNFSSVNCNRSIYIQWQSSALYCAVKNPRSSRAVDWCNLFGSQLCLPS